MEPGTVFMLIWRSIEEHHLAFIPTEKNYNVALDIGIAPYQPWSDSLIFVRLREAAP